MLIAEIFFALLVGSILALLIDFTIKSRRKTKLSSSETVYVDRQPLIEELEEWLKRCNLSVSATVNGEKDFRFTNENILFLYMVLPLSNVYEMHQGLRKSVLNAGFSSIQKSLSDDKFDIETPSVFSDVDMSL